jgi:hypothetical protein
VRAALRARIRATLLALPAVALSTSLGCATLTQSTVTIEGVEPALMELGETRHLVLLEGEGRRSAQQAVFTQIGRQARATGYFSVQDRTAEGHTVSVVGKRADLDGGRRTMPRGQVGLRVAILEWRSHREAQAVKRQSEDGGSYTEVVPFRHAGVVLEISLFDEQGRAHLAQSEFEGHASGEVSRLSRNIVLERAARDAVGKFLDSITPRWVTRRVPLDDDDPEQAPTLEAARAGSIAAAAGDATAYFQRNPSKPSAAYNLAVLLDALGDYQQALAMYDRANRLGAKPFYAESREGCTRRLAAQRALESGPVPASLAPRSR